MNNNKFNIGDRVELLSVDQYDTAYKLKTGDIGIITYLGYKGSCRVDFPNKLNRVIYYSQIKLVEEPIENIQTKEKYVKCIDFTPFWCDLELNKIYKVIDESKYVYRLEGVSTLWGKSKFEEIPNPQNPVKSSVSEPRKSNKMELLMPVLDIIERLQELEVNKDNIEEIISKIESDELIESCGRWHELKIQELEYEKSVLEKENTELKAKIYSMNFDMCDILTIVDKYKEMK